VQARLVMDVVRYDLGDRCFVSARHVE
jgi:hypothetical protein